MEYRIRDFGRPLGREFADEEAVYQALGDIAREYIEKEHGGLVLQEDEWARVRDPVIKDEKSLGAWASILYILSVETGKNEMLFLRDKEGKDYCMHAILDEGVVEFARRIPDDDWEMVKKWSMRKW